MGLEDFEKELAATKTNESEGKQHSSRDDDRRRHRHHHRSSRHEDRTRDTSGAITAKEMMKTIEETDTPSAGVVAHLAQLALGKTSLKRTTTG